MRPFQILAVTLALLAVCLASPATAQDLLPATGCAGTAAWLAPAPITPGTAVDAAELEPLFAPDAQAAAACCSLSEIEQCDSACAYRGCLYSVTCRSLQCQCVCVC